MKFGLKQLIYNNTLLKIVSVAVAVVTWSIVVSTVDQTANIPVKNIAVNLENIEKSTVQKLGLNPINIDKEITADVSVEGKRDIVGNIKKTDIFVEFDLSGITVPGTYDVPLKAVLKSNNDTVEVKGISPSHVSIKFDRIVPKQFNVEADVMGMSVPDGYMMEKEIVNPSTVIVTGPEVDVSRVDRVVAVADVNNTMRETFSKKTPLKLLDRDGNEIKAEYLTMDRTTTEITVPVLKTKNVPVNIDFINIPKDFPLDELEYEFSKETIEIAGPVDKIDSIEELSLGFVDLKNLAEKDVYQFDVSLQKGFINIENIRKVYVTFNLENMKKQEVLVTDIRPSGIPPVYEVSVSTQNLYLNMFGKSEVIDKLVADEIIAEVDFSDRDVKVGQYQMPIKVYVPTGELVLAQGDYQVVVNVKEK